MPPKVVQKEMDADEKVDAVKVYGTMGTLAEFKIDGDWTLYQERMEQHFLANMIPEERKVPLLNHLYW